MRLKRFLYLITGFNNFLVFNKILFKISLKSYNLNLYFLKLNPNMYLLCNFFNTKYNWTDSFENSGIYINFISLKSANIFKIYKNSASSEKLNEIIILKKKSSMFKKNSDKKHIVLNKIFSNKDNFNKNIFKNKKISEYYSNTIPTFFKNFDLSRNLKPFIKLNRKIVKEFYNLKYYRNFSLTKSLKKYNNLNKKDLIVFLENRLICILMRSDIFFNYSDCFWFIKNKLVTVNANLIIDCNFLLKSSDIINVSHNNYYFSFYQFNLDNLLKKITKINQKVWLINNLKYKNKDEDIKYPNWIENYKYFKRDIPINLEIDYISMTIIILDYNSTSKNIDFYNFKFINLYLNRLYNWKFIN